MHKLSWLVPLVALVLTACGTAASELATEPPPTETPGSPEEIFQRQALDTANLLLGSIEDFNSYATAEDLTDAQLRENYSAEALVWQREYENVQAMTAPPEDAQVYAQLAGATEQLNEAAGYVDDWLETNDQAALDEATALAASAAVTLQNVVNELTPAAAP
jgi:hypothetical protein